MTFLFDQCNTVNEVNVPLLGKVSVSSLWGARLGISEIRVSEHAHQRFAQRVMKREQADEQTRARCVAYLRLALIVPSPTPFNLCTARLKRRGVLIQFLISDSGCAVTLVTNSEDDRNGVFARGNLNARDQRLRERKAQHNSRSQGFSRNRPSLPDSHRR